MFDKKAIIRIELINKERKKCFLDITITKTDSFLHIQNEFQVSDVKYNTNSFVVKNLDVINLKGNFKYEKDGVLIINRNIRRE